MATPKIHSVLKISQEDSAQWVTITLKITIQDLVLSITKSCDLQLLRTPHHPSPSLSGNMPISIT